MFHHQISRGSNWLSRLFTRGSDNVLTLAPNTRLRVTNLDVTGETTGIAPIGNWGTTIITQTTFPWTLGPWGNFILSPASTEGDGSSVEIYVPENEAERVGRWVLIRGDTTRDIRIIAPANTLKGHVTQAAENSVLDHQEVDVLLGIRFLGATGRAGDTITLIGDGTHYYFTGSSATEGFALDSD